jgi:hypothetical protein
MRMGAALAPVACMSTTEAEPGAGSADTANAAADHRRAHVDHAANGHLLANVVSLLCGPLLWVCICHCLLPFVVRLLYLYAINIKDRRLLGRPKAILLHTTPFICKRS